MLCPSNIIMVAPIEVITLDPNQLHMEFNQVHVLKVNKKLVQPNLEVLVKSHPMILEDSVDCVIFAVPLKQLMHLNATLFVA